MHNHIHATRHGNITRTLRPDVHRLVSELVTAAKSHPALNEWRMYSSAKSEISRLCGWDAPRATRDQEQFDLAIAQYVRRAGL
jgi:hypothetical protein